MSKGGLAAAGIAPEQDELVSVLVMVYIGHAPSMYENLSASSYHSKGKSVNQNRYQ